MSSTTTSASGAGGMSTTGIEPGQSDAGANATLDPEGGGVPSGGMGGSDSEMSVGGSSGEQAEAGQESTAGQAGNGVAGENGMGGSSEPGETGVFVGATAAHNAVRQAVESNDALPPLVWSDEIAEFAQQWADTLAAECGGLHHRDQGMYGENLAFQGSFGSNAAFTIEEAVENWAAELECWSYGRFLETDSCNSQCIQALNSTGCGHYTQVVWRGTEEVGCGFAACEDEGWLYQYWVCNYSPAGNRVGTLPY